MAKVTCSQCNATLPQTCFSTNQLRTAKNRCMRCADLESGLVCSQCFTELPRACFSLNQLRTGKNRCLVCVGGEAATTGECPGEEESDGEPYWVWCSQCLLLLPRTFFSSNQLRTGKNRCMTCVGNAAAAATLAAHWGQQFDGENAPAMPGALSGMSGPMAGLGMPGWPSYSPLGGIVSEQLALAPATLHSAQALSLWGQNGAHRALMQAHATARAEEAQGRNGHHWPGAAGVNGTVLAARLATNSTDGTIPDLPEEPHEILVVNSSSSGAHAALCAEAKMADLVALDAEWKPDQNDQDDNPISVMQLAFPASHRVYVVQLECLDRQLPAEVSAMLADPDVTKVGFAVDGNDVEKFARSDIKVSQKSLIDIQERCEADLGMSSAPGHLGLKRAAEELLGFYRMDKDKRLSCSDWANPELSPEQVRYAALDAWVTLRLFYVNGENN